MSKKKVSYQNLLKEAISEFDTSKTVDVKGPMLDPILSWDGGGELPIYKDAASILERYYFNETADHGVEIDEMEYNPDGTEKKSAAMKHTHGPGTEQAGTSDAANIPGSKKDAAKDIAKEDEELFEDLFLEQDEDEDEEEEVEEAYKKMKEQDEDEGEDEEEEVNEQEEKDEDNEEEMTEDLENAVIEKLISEMEAEEEEGDEEEVEEGDMSYQGDGVKPGMTAPDEKDSKDPEEHTTGAGTEQAGTGDAEGQVPDRKDMHDKFVKAKKYTDELARIFEQDEDEGEEDEDEDEEKELDVDKEVKEQASGAGHVPPPSLQRKMKTGDQGEQDEYEEAFQLFKEAIEDDDEEEEEEED